MRGLTFLASAAWFFALWDEGKQEVCAVGQSIEASGTRGESAAVSQREKGDLGAKEGGSNW